ncbi:malto-oligosyltrehalose trehalohydrolase [Botryobacter ruber]|uniref:malto-oligosyltrehalose trehalohydrolase n=1 Tax=Botryobacter ruber TaxID=2171629 RepID=UPI000E0C2D56|nr:malto-oligosyltrehalose trehalohydrolase [Botryobacter ruber]
MGIIRDIGSYYTQEKGTSFTVWAPTAAQVEAVITSPKKQIIPLQREAFGYWTGLAEDAKPSTKYFFRLNGKTKRPDPASRSQPDGVHEASEVIDQAAYDWQDSAWKGIPLEEYIIYELHAGTFSEEENFEGVIRKLPELKDLGITAIEIMPVAQFPGSRNWGYDGVYPFAVQNSYGGPEGLKKLVDACHREGLAVILDVVYNHMGPEGNYLKDFGPYFTHKYNTPWGDALNFDDADSDHVRNFFLQNALMWLRDYHIDALRLDAVHAILDMGAKHFLQELQEHVTQLGEQQNREYILIAETDMNNVRLLNPIEQGGYGLAAQWADGYHHAIHTLVTGERDGYYEDYGEPEHLVKALKHTYVYNGIYSVHRRRTVGNDATAIPAKHFVVCSQNHDQVGNRMMGERLTQLISFEQLKVVAGLILLSPYTPMLFMGEEYGEQHPFLYFVSHTDKHLSKLVTEGRRKEFAAFAWKGEAPDPAAEATFEQSKLQHSYHQHEQQNKLREFYKKLIQFRKTAPAFAKRSKEQLTVHFDTEASVLHLIHSGAKPYIYCLFNLSKQPQTIASAYPERQEWEPVLNSADTAWGGPGAKKVSSSSHHSLCSLEPESLIILQSK